MAITFPKNQTLQPDSEIRRTRSVMIERSGAGFMISMIRTISPILKGEIVAGGSEFGISRELSRVVDQTVSIDGMTLTAAQVADAISAFGDKWDREDNKL